MNILLVAPMLLSAGGAIGGWFLPRFVSPATTARVLSFAIVLAAGSIAAALLLVLFAALSEVHAISDLIGWCRALYPGDHGAAPWAGAIAGSLLAVAFARGIRYRRLIRAEQTLFADIDGIEVVESQDPIAFAVPGRPGGVVVGSRLLSELRPDERAAVLAHENAHLRLHHHRYVRTVELCAAGFPFLSPLARQVRFATERWADEAAAVEVGSRRTVARAIARVALMPRDAQLQAMLSFNGGDNVARVDALLHPHDPRRVELPATVVAATVITTLAGSSAQIHHLAVFVAHICPI